LIVGREELSAFYLPIIPKENTMDRSTMQVVLDEIDVLLTSRAVQVSDGAQALALLRSRLVELEDISIREMAAAHEKEITKIDGGGLS
jgi:hypothetical protein